MQASDKWGNEWNAVQLQQQQQTTYTNSIRHGIFAQAIDALPSFTGTSGGGLGLSRNVSVANATTNHQSSKVCSMSSAQLYRSPSSCSTNTPTGSLETHKQASYPPVPLCQPNATVSFDLGQQSLHSKVSVLSSASNTGYFSGNYEPTETPPPVVPISPLLHSLQQQ